MDRDSLIRRGSPLLICFLLLAIPVTAVGQEREAKPDSAGVARDSAGVAADSIGGAVDSAGVAVDSARIAADSAGVAVDSAGIAADSVGAPADTVARRVPSFPAIMMAPDSTMATEAYEWDLEGLLAFPAWSLLDLLTAGVAGITPLRAGFFSGAHQILDGVFGPGFVTVRRNGRVMPPKQAAQLDLASIPLVTLERVRVIRRASGLELELVEKRQAAPVAYARLTSAAGDPGLQLLRGIFTNGFGTALTIGVGLDLLRVSPQQAESSQLHFWGRVNWMPFNNSSGLELVWHNERIERSEADTLEANRRSLVLRARADVSERFQLELTGSTSDLKLDGPTDADEDTTLVDVDEAALTIRASPGRGFVEGGGRVASGSAYAKLVGWLSGGYPVSSRLVVEAGGEVASWDRFSTAFGRLGIAWDPDLGFGLRLHADAGVGTRGLPRPASNSADSVHFTGFTAGASQRLGSFRFGQRFAYQDLSRQLPFDAPFDRALMPNISNVSLPALEGTFRGPVIPVGILITGWNPIVLDGFFRYNLLPGGQNLIYTPETLSVGRFSFDQAFIAGNLRVHLGMFIVHRGQMLSAQPGVAQPEPVGSLTQLGFDVWVGIQSFRLWFRVGDVNGQIAQDVVGVPYPQNRFSIGAKWEFFN